MIQNAEILFVEMVVFLYEEDIGYGQDCNDYPEIEIMVDREENLAARNQKLQGHVKGTDY